MSGVDLTDIDAIGAQTAAVVISEYGADLSSFPTEKAVCLPLEAGVERSQQRWQTAAEEEEEAEQREHAGCRPTAYGRALAAQ